MSCGWWLGEVSEQGFLQAKDLTVLNSLTMPSLTVPTSMHKTLKKTSGRSTMTSTVTRFNIARTSLGGIVTTTLRGNKSCTSLCFRRAFGGDIILVSNGMGGYKTGVSFNVNIHMLTNSRANCTCMRNIAMRRVLHTTHATTHVTSSNGTKGPIKLARGAVTGDHCTIARP